LLAQAEEKIFAINDDRGATTLRPMDELMQDVFRLIDARASGEVDGVSTGFIDLDRMLGGLHGSELIILAARPSMGKTAFATNIADYVAVETRRPTLFFSLEMARTELALRMLCARGRISGERLRGALPQSDQRKFNEAASSLSGAPLYIDDSPSRTVAEIGAVARRLKRQEGLGLIIIDYLGLVEPDNPADPRQEQVAKIARRLKGLARELNVPVLCLSQLNRMTEQMKDNRPRLSHLRESGAIEQDADVVMFVHREEYYHSKEEAEEKGLTGVAAIIVAKQRNGPVGTVKVAWVSKYTLFGNLSEETAPGEYDEFDDFADFAGGNEGAF
ncbi:MAG: replicative DNA helicase, partial [Thermoguttaceae bacterium]|nr:replicative DNA helicase [Thermoguttaceae bacterium]